MRELTNSPYFGIILSILFFEIGLWVNRKTKISILNPLLIAVIGVLLFLTVFNIEFESFNKGGSLISFFLGPATVVLAVPLFKQIKLLKSNFIPILIGVTVGSLTSIISVFFLGKVFGLKEEIILSLIPKSVTTPIGIEISNQIGGISPITVGAIVMTGIIGAVIAPIICKVFKIKDEVAKGIAIGTASHAVGTTKAMEMGETEGAMSSIAIGMAGLITVFLAPFLVLILFK